MSRLLPYLLIISVLLLSCEKDKMGQGKGDPKPVTLEIVYGNNQTGIYNQYVTDSLVVRVTNSKNEAVEGIMVSFKVSMGEGNTSPDYMLSDSSGLAYTKYIADCFSSQNEIIAGIYDSDQVLIDSVVFTIECTFPKDFGKSCGIEDSYLYYSKFRTYLSDFYFISNNRLYVSNTSGVSWEELNPVPSSYNHSVVFDLQFNGKGWMYLLTENNGLFISKDRENWTAINTGFVTTHSPLCMLVTDSVIFASFIYEGLYRSDDNGEFWRKILIDGRYDGFYNFLEQDANGYFYLFDGNSKLWRSIDGGITWVNMNLSREYINSSVSSFIIGSNGMLYIGSKDATLSEVSPESLSGSIHKIEIENKGSIMHLQENNGEIYFNVANYLNNHIYASSANWKKLDIGFTKPIFNFHIKLDGTFIIAAENGLYYKID